MENKEKIQTILVILGATMIGLPVILMNWLINNIYVILSYQFIGVIIFICGMKLNGNTKQIERCQK